SCERYTIPVLPRPTSLITTYLPIFSGMRRCGTGLGDGVDSADMGSRNRQKRGTAYGPEQRPYCDASRRVLCPCGHPRPSVRGVLGVEVTESRMREVHHTRIASQHAGTWGRDQNADPAIAPLFRRHLSTQACDGVRMRSETQLVVLTACQRQGMSSCVTDRFHESVGDRNAVELDIDSAAAGLRELPCVPEQAVGNVDAGAGKLPQALAEGHTRRWEKEALAQVFGGIPRCAQSALLQGQSGRRVAGSSGHEHDVPGLASAAQQSPTSRNVAEQLHRDAQWARSCVAADERNRMSKRERGESRGKLSEPGLVRRWQRQ